MLRFVVLGALTSMGCDQVLGLELRTPSCPSAFSTANYLVIQNPQPYSVAEAFCRSLSVPGSGNYSHLVVLGDDLEGAVLPSFVVAEVWVGLNDRETEGVHRWITNESTVPIPWDIGQPNETPAPQDCAVWRTGGLHDRDCDERYMYVCECDEFPVELDRI